MRRLIVLASVLVAVILAGSPATAATKPLPVPYNFLPAAVLGGTPDSNAPGTNDWTCKPSAVQLQQFVDRVLASTGASKVDLVGHSQGTLMPQYYVKFLGGASKVLNYISLASLWHGTEIFPPAVAASLGLDPSTIPVCAACGEFDPSSTFMKEIREGGVAAPGVHYVNIVTKYDELVRPYTSGIEPGMTNIVLQDKCALDYTEHFEIAADRNASLYVLNALDPAHPRPITCTLTLPFVGGL